MASTSALVGPNGSGKTTLLETARCATDGVRIGHGVELGYFSQQEIELDDARQRPRVRPVDDRAVAAPTRRTSSAASSSPAGTAHEKAGHRALRAASGGASRSPSSVASGANFLVLDEPTNHLDLESREALEAALDAFPGTVLLVSHDRALLDAVADRTAGDRGPGRCAPTTAAGPISRGHGRSARHRPPEPRPKKEPKPRRQEGVAGDRSRIVSFIDAGAGAGGERSSRPHRGQARGGSGA